MSEPLTEEDLGLILSYLLVYQDLCEKEDIFKKFCTHGMKLGYLNAHAHYERSLGGIVQHYTPIHFIEKLNQIRQLCDDIEADVAENFNLQNSEE